MFDPPRCPNRSCSQHHEPRPRFYRRKGSYQPKCRPKSVPRFQCKDCGRGFSRQTFRMDYRDHRPHLNAQLFRLLASGVGLRQASRLLRLSLSSTQLKFRKISRHLRRLNLLVNGQLPPGSVLVFDEFQSFEGCRLSRPLSVPVLIERESGYVLWAESAPIRPTGKLSERRKRAVERDRARFGERPDTSMRSIRRTFSRGADCCKALDRIELHSDERPSYPSLAREVFGARLLHVRTSGQLARGSWNPLFSINHTEAMMRDLMGRLRRNSWLASKRRRFLDLGMALWTAWRNLVRRRTNGEHASPAQVLGFVGRRFREEELLTWRQDWGTRSLRFYAR